MADTIIVETMIEDNSWISKRFFPTGEAVDIIYQGTFPGSPARSLIVDMHAHDGNADWLENGSSNPEFLADLTKALYKAREECDCGGDMKSYSGPVTINPIKDPSGDRWTYRLDHYHVRSVPDADHIKEAMVTSVELRE